MSPLEKLDTWLDERLGHRALLKEALDEPIVGGARWAYVFGSALTLAFVIQALTGVLLMTGYAPSAQTAWASVHYISFGLAGGWLVRGLHHFGAQAMVVLLGLHLAQVALFGAYKRPREFNWWLGLGLMAVTLGFALTGYLLPWDQKGYWATQVATNIAGTTPGIGRTLQELIQGGPQYGSLTLTRFFTLHVAVLPGALVALLVMHIALFRRHGVTPPAKHDPQRVDLFWPKQVGKDLAAGLVLLGILFALVLREHGAPLDAPADPASDYPARPEWYFLPLFELLKHFHGSLEIVGTMVIPGLAGAYLFALPLLDRSPGTALRGRLVALAPLVLGGAAVVYLMGSALSADANDKVFQAARAKANERAERAIALAREGIPVEGPLAMLRNDPELRGESLFSKHCASCHVLGEAGDRKKATAPVLDGWSTVPWIEAMLRDPDADERFGRTPFREMMPSMTKPAPESPSARPVLANDEEVRAVATFLAAQGDVPGEEAARDKALVGRGRKIVAERCTTCHLFEGQGDESSSEVAPELSGYGSLAWVRAQIKNPATSATYREKALDPELKGHMPRFDDDLPPSDIEVLARWVRARARGVPLTRVPADVRAETPSKVEHEAVDRGAFGSSGSVTVDAAIEAGSGVLGSSGPNQDRADAQTEEAPSPDGSAVKVPSSAKPAAVAAAAVAKPSSSGAPAALGSSPRPAPSAAPGSEAAPPCGTKPLPDCPMQAWMKANASVASAAEDLPALAAAFDRIATMAPPGYSEWANLSREGAKAARSGDVSAARASCKGCHQKFQQRYRAEMRARPIR